jgi:hypothetical protein
MRAALPDLPFEVPDVHIGLTPQYRFPVGHGTALFNAPRDDESHNNVIFNLAIGLGEPEILRGHEVVHSLAQLSRHATDLIDNFRADI